MNIVFRNVDGILSPGIIDNDQFIIFRKEDREEVIDLIAKKYYDGNLMWTIDPEKIYSVEGKYEIKEVCEICKPDFNCAEYHQENSCSMIQKFAILLKEEPVKEAEKEESQRDLFEELFNLYDGHKGSIEIMSKFTIARIK